MGSIRLGRGRVISAAPEPAASVAGKGALVVSLLAGVGAAMTNYAWREAQWEELRSAVRAPVSSAGPLLAGAGGPTRTAIEERVGAFLRALLPGLTLDSVTVSHVADTGVTTVTVAGRYAFQSLWAGGRGAAESISESVDVVFEVDHYEVAVALDLSSSMQRSMPSGTPGVRIAKLDGLKQAMGSVLSVVEAARARSMRSGSTAAPTSRAAIPCAEQDAPRPCDCEHAAS